jgi:hypothetical protein
VKDFRDLQVWHKAHHLTLAVYRFTATFPREERYGLTTQLRRSSSSIAANLAEGCGRNGDADLADVRGRSPVRPGHNPAVRRLHAAAVSILGKIDYLRGILLRGILTYARSTNTVCIRLSIKPTAARVIGKKATEED